MNYFDHEKLDVYKAAVDLVTLINSVVQNYPVVERTLLINYSVPVLLFHLISRKVLENFHQMKKSGFIEWQEDQPQSVQAYLIFAND